MLSDKALRALKPRDKLYRIADSGGLCIEVAPTGSRLWRYRYRFAGRASMLSLGAYPTVGLSDARVARDEAKALLRQGRDPAAERQAAKTKLRREVDAAFPQVSAAWLEHKKREWADETYRKANYVLDEYLIPALRRTSIATLSSKDAADALGTIPPTLAAKARQYLGGMVTFAIRHGLRDEGRMLALRGAVPKQIKNHIPAATTPKEAAAVAKAIDAYPVPVTRAALSLAMLTAMRPGIVASARWSEIDLEAAEWHVPGERMKTRHAHIVPLPTQAVKVLREMRAYTDGATYVFPPLARQTSAHLHRDSLSAALRRMGFAGRHATHGFRGMLRTVARERLGIDPDVLEAQLAHAKRGDVQKAYDRTTFDDQRREAMQAWADYLDTLKGGGTSPPSEAKGRRSRLRNNSN